MDKKQLIAELFERDILLSPEQVNQLSQSEANEISLLLDKPEQLEAYLAKPTATKQAAPIVTPAVLPRASSGISIVKHYAKKPKKRSYQDFVGYWNARFTAMERFLRSRQDLRGVMSIDRTKQFSASGDKGKSAIIGIVLDKRETKNGHLVLEIEDRSGSLAVLCTKGKAEVFDVAKDLCLDEMIGVVGSLREGTMFADSIVLPSLPVGNELKKAPDEVYAVCISDIHFGNKNFFEKEFSLFLDWLAGNAGTEESKRVAAKTKYVFIPGDVVEGVGVYPTQEKDLSVLDIYDQYKLADEWLSRIPPDKHVFVIPGNHDIGRLSEPQPALSKEVLPKLAARENTYMLSNPSVVRIHQTTTFPGFNVLLYHGGSFIYYGNNVMRLFQEGGMSNPCAVMQYLLTRRHLAPTHTATLYVPDAQEDPLIIDEIPDFLITGHLHTTQHRTWNGVTMLSCSCWVPITDYQMKSGLKIDPGKFMLINLQTRQTQALKPEDVL